MRYAMVLKNKVIDVLNNCAKEPHYPPDKDGNPVVAVECEDNVEIGFEYDSTTNTFVDPNYVPLTESEELQIDILLNTEYIACLLELQMG